MDNKCFFFKKNATMNINRYITLKLTFVKSPDSGAKAQKLRKNNKTNLFRSAVTLK